MSAKITKNNNRKRSMSRQQRTRWYSKPATPLCAAVSPARSGIERPSTVSFAATRIVSTRNRRWMRCGRNHHDAPGRSRIPAANPGCNLELARQAGRTNRQALCAVRNRKTRKDGNRMQNETKTSEEMERPPAAGVEPVKNCFTCKFRFRQLAPDSWGNRPYRCSEKGGLRLTWGQDKPCPQNLWQPKEERRPKAA